MLSRRAVLLAPGKFEIQEFDIEPQAKQVLIKTYSCGLCNWELNHWGGTFGTYPQGVGHEWGGTIIKVGAEVAKFKVGDRVTALPSANSTPGFADYIVEDESHLFKVEDGIDMLNAMLEPLKCIITIIKSSEAKAGDFGVVLGAGPMGLWCVQGLAGNLLSKLIVVDIDEKKLELAKKYGATDTINPSKCDTFEELKKLTSGHLADFVIEGTGIPEVFGDALKFTAHRGRVVLMSSHERVAREFDFRPAISKGLTIVAPHPQFSNNQLDDARRAAEFISNGKFKMAELVNYKFSLDNITEAFNTLKNKPKDYIKGCVFFGD